MSFSENTQLKEIYDSPHLAPIRDCLISGGSFFLDNGELTLAQLQEKNPTWNTADILYGLKRLESPYDVCGVYKQEVHRLGAVKLTWLPAKEKIHNTFVILLAGGAYGAVCTMVESLPVAAKLNELGYDCFCLNYRTAVRESFVKGLLPEPLDDLAAAIRYIEERSTYFGVDTNNYAVSGFSAGGHTASLWGTEHLGARKYGIRQPKCLILGYPLITMANVPESPLKQYMCSGMFGSGFTDEDIQKYDASRHVDSAYPPTFIVRAADDPTVSVRDGDAMLLALKDKCLLEPARHGGHGFGLGSATPLRGWVDRAAQWMEGL